MFKELAPIFIELAWRSPASPSAPSGRDADTLRSVSNRKVTIRTHFPRISRPRESPAPAYGDAAMALGA